jgi:hypothetical protein
MRRRRRKRKQKQPGFNTLATSAMQARASSRIVNLGPKPL